jgi:hypothetical protein
VHTQRGDQAPLISYHGWGYSDGPGSYLFKVGAAQIFLVPEVFTQVQLACMDLRPQVPWEASLAIWTMCPEAYLSRSVSPGTGPQSQQPRRQKCQLYSLPFLANAAEMLWE